MCEKDATKKVNWTAGKSEDCLAEMTYTGPEGCKKYTVEIEKYMKQIAPFIGAILILVGGALCFAGAKFLLYALAALVFMLVTSLLFSIFYSLMPSETSSVYVLIGGLVACSIVGGLVAYFG